MTYEEKLDLIIKAVVEGKKATRQGHPVKIYLDSNTGLDKLSKDEIREIVLKLKADEDIVSLNDVYNRLLPLNEQPKNLNYLQVDVTEKFDDWYENYLMTMKSKLENLDYINMLRIYDVVLDINEQIQITNDTTVYVPLLPSLIRFAALFPADTIGMRDKYCRARIDSLVYMQKKSFIDDFSNNQDNWDTVVTVTLKLSKFDEFYKSIMEEYQKRNKHEQEQEIKGNSATVATNKVTYDTKKGILTLDSKEVQFKKDSFKAKLIELLLKDEKSRKKEWSWDEVVEKIQGVTDQDSLNSNKKKFYPACDGISRSVAQKISINDLLIYNKSTVQINPKYL